MRRNREGIAMLFSRGVTDAMLQRYYVGWDGRYLVHPVRDRYGGYLEVPIGEYVRLEPDDTLTIAAPFGLEDLFALRLRPNPNRRTAGFPRTSASIAARWPEVRIEP